MIRKGVRYFLVVLLMGAVLVNLALAASRYHFQSGVECMHQKEYAAATEEFGKARKMLPDFLFNSLFRADLYRIHMQAGINSHKRALSLWKDKGSAQRIYTLYRESEKNLKKAMAVDGRIWEAAYWLARTETSLEIIYPHLYPAQNNPYDPWPMYQRTLDCRPNFITGLYSLARYLFYKENFAKLSDTVCRMVRIYPPVYRHLKNEVFYGENLLPGIKKGLLDALEENTNPRSALQAMSDVLAYEKSFEKAAELYKNSLEIRPFSNSYQDLIAMGKLYLKSGDVEKSRRWFTRGIKKADRFDAALYSVFQIYKKEEKQTEFIRLCMKLKKDISDIATDIYIAKAWMDLGKFPLARSRLLPLTAENPTGQVYYLLARIAREAGDWSRMELAAQKAGSLDPDNPEYYRLFARALMKQNKYYHAEKITTKALSVSEKGDPRLFSQRAWTRWAQKKYASAISDWKRAFDIKPDSSVFPYQIARAYEREGMFEQGLAYIEKAIALEPDNQTYKELKARLR